MPARRTPKHRRRGLARLLPDESQGASRPGLPYPGLQHGCDPEAAAWAALLIEQGYGALEPWLSAEPAAMTIQELCQAAARGCISGFDAAELWRRQQRQQQQHKAMQKRIQAVDWGDSPEDQAA